MESGFNRPISIGTEHVGHEDDIEAVIEVAKILQEKNKEIKELKDALDFYIERYSRRGDMIEELRKRIGDLETDLEESEKDLETTEHNLYVVEQNLAEAEEDIEILRNEITNFHTTYEGML